ncbi:hypothetical protein NYY68_13440 [Acinetobacter baumannii]|nr:hypothetical protein [Acinetobacter baumannii]
MNLNLPTPWICHELNLNFNRSSLTWNDPEGNIIIRNINIGTNICTLLNYKVAEKLFNTDKTFISIYLSERGAWLNGSNNNVSWVRVEGVCWKNGKRIFEKTKVENHRKPNK